MNNLPSTEVKGQYDPKYLSSALYLLSKSSPYYASLLQEVSIKYSHRVPTAALIYDKKLAKFMIELNYEFFSKMTLQQRSAILFHEILHFVHSHLIRSTDYDKMDDENKKLLNIAQDMAINQYITGLPPGGVDIKDFSYVDAQGKDQAFPGQKPFELYLELLQDNKKLTPQTQQKVKNFMPMDIHDWFDGLTESEKKQFMEEMKETLKRSIEKSSHGHSDTPDFIKDLINKLEVQIAALDYKRILAACIKKTATAKNRDRTWSRPNKRYGVYAPGSKNAKLPRIHFFFDVSGSISYTEINEFIKVVEGFLQVGENDCKISFWDTSVHNTVRFKKKQSLDSKDITNGGTDPNCALEMIEKLQPNLSVVLTDGYYGNANKKYKVTGDLLWVISKNGQKEHTLKNMGKTVKMV